MDHRQTEARCEVHYLYRSSLLILFGLHGLQRREALGRGKDPRDRIDGHALGLEEGDTACVRNCLSAATGFRQVHRIPRCGIVEFGRGRQSLLGKAVTVPTADAGDEVAWWHRSRPVRNHLLELRDRSRRLDDPYFMPGIDAAADEMDM